MVLLNRLPKISLTEKTEDPVYQEKNILSSVPVALYC